MDVNQLKIISFNCMGVKNILPVIRDLCSKCDILILQETWLLPNNLSLLDKVHSEFTSFSMSSVDMSTQFVGRPYGGLSIMWRKSIGDRCSIITFDDDRILGLKFCGIDSELLIINVYLPYFSLDNYDNYLHYVGKLNSIVESTNDGEIMILGDFNAATGGEYFREWDILCNDHDMLFSDVLRLPADSYTHVNNGSMARSWLDHCLCSETVPT